MFMDGWMDKENVAYIFHCMSVYIHTHNGILLSYKKNEIVLFATTWMDPEDIMLSEVSETKINAVLSQLDVESKEKQKNQLIDTENRLVVARGGGGGG